MKFTLTTTLLLLKLAWSLPVPDNEEIIINKTFFPEELVVYTGKHDIVNLVVPLNSLNFVADDSNLEDSLSNVTVFFAEADIDDFGKRTYKGLYVLKNGKATKILENGVDAASSADSSTIVYLAASDGIYIYSPEHLSPVKYSSISDNVIGIAHEAASEVFYILTADHGVYKVLENGTKKEKLEDVINAQQIVLDYSNNLYFFSPDKKVHVKTSKGVEEIKGLPESPSKYSLIKPPIDFEDGVIWVADGTVYLVFANATSKKTDIKFEITPTSYASEAALVQYYAYNKKIYEYNIISEPVRQLEKLETEISNKINKLGVTEKESTKESTFNENTTNHESV